MLKKEKVFFWQDFLPIIHEKINAEIEKMNNKAILVR